jgi:hypothetical protein
MSEQQSSPSSKAGGLPNMMSLEFTERLKKNGEAMAAIQKEWMELIEQDYRDWMGALTASATLQSELLAKMKNAKSVPDATAAYQEWANRQLEIYTSHSRKAMEQGQKMTTAWVRMFGNGRGGLGT